MADDTFGVIKNLDRARVKGIFWFHLASQDFTNVWVYTVCMVPSKRILDSDLLKNIFSTLNTLPIHNADLLGNGMKVNLTIVKPFFKTVQEE